MFHYHWIDSGTAHLIDTTSIDDLAAKQDHVVACCSEVDRVESVLKKYRETPETFNDIFCRASVLSEMIGTKVTMPRLASWPSATSQ